MPNAAFLGTSVADSSADVVEPMVRFSTRLEHFDLRNILHLILVFLPLFLVTRFLPFVLLVVRLYWKVNGTVSTPRGANSNRGIKLKIGSAS